MIDQTVPSETHFTSADVKQHHRRFSAQLLFTALVGDAAVIFISLALSSWLRFETRLAHFGRGAEIINWRGYFGHAGTGAALFVLLLPLRTFYDRRTVLDLPQTVRVIVRTALRWLIAFIAFSWLLRMDADISRVYIAVGFVVTPTLFIVWRALLHRLIGRDWEDARFLHKRVLFVGWSPQAAALERSIVNDVRHPYEVAGHISPSEIGEALENGDVDTVILANSDLTAEETLPLANICEREMIEFKVIPTCFQILISCLRLQHLAGVPVLGIEHEPLDNPFSALLKRSVDVAGGLVGVILSAPIILLFGVIVYLESPGPIIYRQRRSGQDGSPFWIFKIRSMKMDAEAAGRAGWTVRDDPRRLRIGAFMRRWNIDELPQFWNVLKGEMSLVGPRPERPELIQRFKDEIPHYNARHSIKPGMTGWAQVNGFRGDTDLNERIRCDLYYIENWSLLLDIQIMAMTPFRHKNAQ